ncbi:hypothetical protein EX30DRAFT_85551 [Ascodesmis nigricans]|uniref:Uncharacterized protein n=1 Tax=Ascodesmis nigricans TaxID=341454 RepID=A0A4V3SJD3_9PEZI|nr:hypothetical protein EX30DRAFT_85551 [Ascodesmis nigricans]
MKGSDGSERRSTVTTENLYSPICLFTLPLQRTRPFSCPQLQAGLPSPSPFPSRCSVTIQRQRRVMTVLKQPRILPPPDPSTYSTLPNPIPAFDPCPLSPKNDLAVRQSTFLPPSGRFPQHSTSL